MRRNTLLKSSKPRRERIVENIIKGNPGETIIYDGDIIDTTNRTIRSPVSGTFDAARNSATGTVFVGTAYKYSAEFDGSSYRIYRVVFDINMRAETLTNATLYMQRPSVLGPDCYLYVFNRNTAGTTISSDYGSFGVKISDLTTENASGELEFVLNQDGLDYFNANPSSKVGVMIRDSQDADNVIPTSVDSTNQQGWDTVGLQTLTASDDELRSEETSVLVKSDGELYTDDGSGNIEELINQGGGLINPTQTDIAKRPVSDDGILFGIDSSLVSEMKNDVTELSFGGWIDLQTPAVDSIYGIISTIYADEVDVDGTGFSAGIRVDSTLGEIYAEVAVADGTLQPSDNVCIYDISSLLGDYIHILGVFSENLLRLYVNGELRTTKSLTTNNPSFDAIPANSNEILFVGQGRSFRQYLPTGSKLDELLVDRRVYSATEVFTLVKSSKHYGGLDSLRLNVFSNENVILASNSVLLDGSNKVETAYNLSQYSVSSDANQTTPASRFEVNDGFVGSGSASLRVTVKENVETDTLSAICRVYLTALTGTEEHFISSLYPSGDIKGFQLKRTGTTNGGFRAVVRSGEAIAGISSTSYSEVDFLERYGSRWVTLAMTFDGTMLSLYVDGLKFSTTIAYTKIPIAEVDAISIGTSLYDTGSLGVDNKIDNIEIYVDKVLSKTDIYNFDKKHCPSQNILINYDNILLDTSDKVEMAYNLSKYSEIGDVYQDVPSQRLSVGVDGGLEALGINFLKTYLFPEGSDFSYGIDIKLPNSVDLGEGTYYGIMGNRVSSNNTGTTLIIRKFSGRVRLIFTFGYGTGSAVFEKSILTSTYDSNIAEERARITMQCTSEFSSGSIETDLYPKETVIGVGGSVVSNEYEFRIGNSSFYSQLPYYTLYGSFFTWKDEAESLFNNDLRVNSQNVILDTNSLVQTAENKSFRSALGDSYQDISTERYKIDSNGGFTSPDNGFNYLKAKVLDKLHKVSVSCWFKTDSAATLIEENNLIGNSNKIDVPSTMYSGFTLRLRKTSGQVSLEAFFGKLDGSLSLYSLLIGTEAEYDALYAGMWAFYAFTFSGDRLKLYVNGDFEYSTSFPITVISESLNPLVIGARLGTLGDTLPFGTLIDQICYKESYLSSTAIHKQRKAEQIRYPYLNN